MWLSLECLLQLIYGTRAIVLFCEALKGEGSFRLELSNTLTIDTSIITDSVFCTNHHSTAGAQFELFTQSRHLYSCLISEVQTFCTVAFFYCFCQLQNGYCTVATQHTALLGSFFFHYFFFF